MVSKRSVGQWRAYDRPRSHSKTARSGYISTERDGYFAGQKVAVTLRRDEARPRNTASPFRWCRRDRLDSGGVTIGLVLTAKRLGRATSRRSEMATLPGQKVAVTLRRDEARPRNTASPFRWCRRDRLDSGALTIGLVLTAKRLGRATSRRSEMATLRRKK